MLSATLIRSAPLPQELHHMATARREMRWGFIKKQCPLTDRQRGFRTNEFTQLINETSHRLSVGHFSVFRRVTDKDRKAVLCTFGIHTFTSPNHRQESFTFSIISGSASICKVLAIIRPTVCPFLRKHSDSFAELAQTFGIRF